MTTKNFEDYHKALRKIKELENFNNSLRKQRVDLIDFIGIIKTKNDFVIKLLNDISQNYDIDAEVRTYLMEANLKLQINNGDEINNK